MTTDEKIKLINEKCLERNFKFHGFVEDGKHITVHTKLKLECLKCGHKWETTQYNNFIKKGKCQQCHFNEMKKIRKKKQNEVLQEILKICNLKNLIFLNFVEGEYINAKQTHLHLKCKICNHEWKTTTYENFLKMNSCPICTINKNRLKNDIVLEKIRDKCKEHNCTFLGFVGGKYINNNTKLILKCNKCNEIWNTTAFRCFVYTNVKCPKCRKSFLEMTMENFLKENKIIFSYEQHFDWLGKQSLDFYIPSKNIAIECQGIQHFEPRSFGSKKDKSEIFKKFNRQKELDETKRKLCEIHNIKLLYFTDIKEIKGINIITSLNEILEIIKNTNIVQC